MPRYLINVDTRTVHSADCDRVHKNVVPWPRFEYEGQGTCSYCLPHGFPRPVTKQTREQVVAAHDHCGQVVVSYVSPVGDDVLPAAPALPAERRRAAGPLQGKIQGRHPHENRGSNP